MSLEADNDSECEVQPAIRAAIDVKIGNINITAILDDTCAINAIHKKVFKLIFSLDEAGETYGEVENIELDFTIDGRSVTAVFRVLGNLYSDMTLGKEFFQSVKAHIHLELRLLKWSYQDELVITSMIENDANFRALSGGSDAFNEGGSLKKEIETGEASVEVKGDCKIKKKRKKKSKKTDRESAVNNDAPSTSTDAASLSDDLDLLTLNSGKAATKDVKKDEFVKICIAEQEQWDILSGECLAYYVVYSSEKKIVFFGNEVLQCKEKTPLGYYMEALHNAFCQAGKHGIKHLHLISDNNAAVQLMKAQQKEYEEYGEVDLTELPLYLCRPDDFVNYYTASLGIPGFESLKFEFVRSDDEKYEDMVHARELIEQYMEKTPM